MGRDMDQMIRLGVMITGLLAASPLVFRYRAYRAAGGQALTIVAVDSGARHAYDIGGRVRPRALTAALHVSSRRIQ